MRMKPSLDKNSFILQVLYVKLVQHKNCYRSGLCIVRNFLSCSSFQGPKKFQTFYNSLNLMKTISQRIII